MTSTTARPARDGTPADERGDTATASELVRDALRRLPGHQELIRFATEIGGELPAGRR
jgi:hypothetical protein